MSVERRKITNISSVGIVFRASDPRQIFIEMKDDGHPIHLVRRQLCPIGGNWIGELAKDDTGPLDTFRRELREELSLDRPIRSAVELARIGLADPGTFNPTPVSGVVVDDRVRQNLEMLKEVICARCVPFGTYLNRVTKAAMDSADPSNTREEFTTLACYWAIALSEADWCTLVVLQDMFGNLSNEALTLVTSLGSILETGTRTAFGHDFALREFWLAMGLSRARQLPGVQSVESVYAGSALPTYEEYLKRYDIAKKPI